MRYFLPSEVEISIDIIILDRYFDPLADIYLGVRLRGLRGQTRDFSLLAVKSKGRINVGSFLNLANLIWGEFFSFLSLSRINSVSCIY